MLINEIEKAARLTTKVGDTFYIFSSGKPRVATVVRVLKAHIVLSNHMKLNKETGREAGVPYSSVSYKPDCAHVRREYEEACARREIKITVREALLDLKEIRTEDLTNYEATHFAKALKALVTKYRQKD